MTHDLIKIGVGEEKITLFVMLTLTELKDLYEVDMSAKFDVTTSLGESIPFGT